MKAISIKQPWASLIVHGIKDIENRTWKCPQKYIGQRVLIHSSKTAVKDGWKALTREQLKKVIPHKNKLYGDNEELPHSAIIGSVVIADCVQNHSSVWAEKGCWNWVLKDAVLFDKPIMNVKGKLSFWEYDMYNIKTSDMATKKEYKIGETFKCGLVTLKCVKGEYFCKGCIFDNNEKLKSTCRTIILGDCRSEMREDGTNAIFVEVDDNEPKPTPATETNSIDWEQRRYEIAKECVSVLMRNEITLHDAAKISVEQADALIEELKKSKND